MDHHPFDTRHLLPISIAGEGTAVNNNGPILLPARSKRR
jgi:hypothetical protein